MFRKTERNARKRHRCTFCESAIQPGTRYIDGFWLYEGDPASWKAHTDCQALADLFPAAYEGVPPFADWYPDDIPDELRPELRRLMERAKAESAP